jgi:hypothetical protein
MSNAFQAVSNAALGGLVVGASAPTAARLFPVSLPMRFAAAQPPTASAATWSESPTESSASGSDSGGS